MFPSKQLQQVRSTYHAYPRQFWLLLFGSFVDHLGGALVFTFFALYVSKRFDVDMTSLGALVALFSLANLLGGILGGALADRVGRKATMLMGLLVSGMTSLLMGWANSLPLLSLSTFVVGSFANAGAPARQAMIADLLPEEQRAQGFGLMRVVLNLAVAIGPTVGGLLATKSFFLLFVGDAIGSLLTAIFVSAVLHETRPGAHSATDEGNLLRTLRGYGILLKDSRFVLFVLLSLLVMMVSIQLNVALPVYLWSAHGVSEQGFGYILTLNAGMVVLLQFLVTRRTRAYPTLVVAAVGAAVYGAGYVLYGLVSAYVLFLAAMAVVTMGEMIFFPTAQAVAAQLAPEDMRGRYLAAFGFSFGISGMAGPLLFGWVMDHADPRLAWYLAGLVGCVAAVGFLLLHRRLGGSLLGSAPHAQPGAQSPSG